MSQYGSLDKLNPCRVCLGPPGPYPVMNVYHKHYSTRYFFNNSKTAGREEVYCESCREVHPVVGPQRLKIISTTSTLYGVPHAATFPEQLSKFKTYIQSEGAETCTRYHVDLDAIPGGRIFDTQYSWHIQYYDQDLPMDVAVVAGSSEHLNLFGGEPGTKYLFVRVERCASFDSGSVHGPVYYLEKCSRSTLR